MTVLGEGCAGPRWRCGAGCGPSTCCGSTASWAGSRPRPPGCAGASSSSGAHWRAGTCWSAGRRWRRRGASWRRPQRSATRPSRWWRARGHAAAFGARHVAARGDRAPRGPPTGAFGPPVDLADGQLRAALFARLGPAAALAESGRLDEAAHHYRLAGPPQSWDIPPYFRMPALAVGASVAILLGLRADVAWFRAALADQRSGHVVGGGGAASYGGPVALVLGRCAAALDDLDAAADLLGSPSRPANASALPRSAWRPRASSRRCGCAGACRTRPAPC